MVQKSYAWRRFNTVNGSCLQWLPVCERMKKAPSSVISRWLSPHASIPGRKSCLTAGELQQEMYRHFFTPPSWSVISQTFGFSPNNVAALWLHLASRWREQLCFLSILNMVIWRRMKQEAIPISHLRLNRLQSCFKINISAWFLC